MCWEWGAGFGTLGWVKIGRAFHGQKIRISLGISLDVPWIGNWIYIIFL